MSGPAYHGRTHIPGGTDPIPGLVPAVTRFDATLTCPGGGDPAPGPALGAFIDYVQIGQLVQGWVSVFFGGTATDFGSGVYYQLSLPFAASAEEEGGSLGTGFTIDNSAGLYLINGIYLPGAGLDYINFYGPDGPVGPTNPFAFAHSDFIFSGPISYYTDL